MKNLLNFNGNFFDSIYVGQICIESPSAASWCLTLPLNDGSVNQFLQTDGNGVTTWANAVTSAPTGFQVIGNALSYGPSLIPIANGGTNSSTATGTGSVVLQNAPSIINDLNVSTRIKVLHNLGDLLYDSITFGNIADTGCAGVFRFFSQLSNPSLSYIETIVYGASNTSLKLHFNGDTDVVRNLSVGLDLLASQKLTVMGNGIFNVNNGFASTVPISLLDIGSGADLSGGGGSNQISFQYQTGNNGFRHFIQSRHNSTASPNTGNALWFFMNQSNLGATSTAPGTGNVVAFKITGDGVEAPVKLTTPIVSATTSVTTPVVSATTSSLTPSCRVGATNYTNITTQATTPNVVFNLPTNVGVNGDYLLNNGSGNLSWTAGFSSGTWTPAFKYIDAAGAIVVPNATLTNTLYNGYYTKFGRNVTVFYDVLLESTNGDQFLSGTRYPVITGLPFTCNVSTGGSQFVNRQPMNTCSYPNGYAGPIPAVAFPVYGTERAQAVINGSGESVPMNYINIVTIATTPWISDGNTIQLYCPSEFFAPVLTVPPYALAYTLDAPLVNVWIVGAGSFPNIRFKGSISYLTTS